MKFLSHRPLETVEYFFKNGELFQKKACALGDRIEVNDTYLRRLRFNQKWIEDKGHPLNFDTMLIEDLSVGHKVVKIRTALMTQTESNFRITYYPTKDLETSSLGRNFSLFDNIQETIIISEAEPIDTPGPRIIYTNKAFERLTGYSSKEVIGLNPRLLQGADSSALARAEIRKGLANWEHVTQEIKNYKKSGEPFYTQLNIHPVRDEAGWWTHWVSFQKDLTKEKASRSSLERLQEIAHVGHWRLTVKTMKTLWSSEVYRIHGLPEGTPTNTIDGISFYAPREREKITRYVSKCISDGEVFDDIFEFYDAENKKKWVRSYGEPIIEANGEVLEICGVFQDVSEMYNERLQLKTILDNSPEIIYRLDEYGKYTFVSEAWTRLNGHFTQEVVGQHFTKFVFPEDQESFEREFAEIFYGKKKKTSFEYRIIDQTNQLRWHRTSAQLLDDGKPQIQGITRDISTEKDLRDELRSILNVAAVGIWKWDIKQNSLFWDESMYDLFGLSRKEFSGDFDAWEKSLHPEDKERAKTEVELALAGKKVFDTTFRIITQSGEVRYIKGKADVIRDAEGNPVVMRGVNFDQTKEKVAEQMRDEERQKSLVQSKLASIGELASGVGHEINNPLAIAFGGLWQLSEILPEDPEIRRITGTIEKGLERINNITKGLRNFSRSDSKRTQFKIFDAVTESVDFIKDIYRSYGIRLKLDYVADQAILVTGNRGEFLQVLMNLLSNAKDATEGQEERLIEVFVKSDEPTEIGIEVKDNGTGIPVDIQEKIFNPFFTTKDVGKGTGIGLSIATQLIQSMKGNISFHTAEDRGTTFRVTLPVWTGPTEIESATNTPLLELPRPGLRVLLVEDEADLSQLIRRMLEGLRCVVDQASDGEEALKRLKAQEFDLVVSDIQIPKIKGTEVMRRLRATGISNQPVFIFISGGISSELSPDGLTNVEARYLRKPFTTRDLAKAIKEICPQE